MSTTNPRLLESLLHHIALPPQLPQHQERNLTKIQESITSRVLAATNTLKNLDTFGPAFDVMRRSILTCQSINSSGTISKSSLISAFQELERESKEILILHITEQNASLLIRRSSKDDIVLFEAFETSPLSRAVLAAQGPLQWDFPGCAVNVPISTFAKPAFQVELAACLSQASNESIKRFAAKARKAGTEVSEIRDTVDPALITSMLMTILEVNGARAFPPLLRKHVRDEAYWSEGGERPWRRSPFWLALRVGIQRHLSTILGGEIGRVHYKFLICQVLSHLLEECVGPAVDIELVLFLKTKLCRRLAKLKVDRETASVKVQGVYDIMFETLGLSFDKAVKSADTLKESTCANFKQQFQRPVLLLPRHANPRHLQLYLPNSRNYISKVLLEYQSRSRSGFQPVAHVPSRTDFSSIGNKESLVAARRYFSLSESEIDIEQHYEAPPTSNTDCGMRCCFLAKQIAKYLVDAGDAYDGNPEQKSIMLLTIMELWVQMDKCAVQLYDLLQDYNPVFPSNLLDVLHISRLQDMHRLQNLRSYLESRHAACKSERLTIFSNPVEGCFGERYFEESPDSGNLKMLRREIEDDAEKDREAKREEWADKREEHQQLIRQVAAETHIQEVNQDGDLECIKMCTKCFLYRRARRVKIEIHEHPLPSNPVQSKVVVFELACPVSFAEYREATWRIIASLAVPFPLKCSKPNILLEHYSGLKDYMLNNEFRFTLASDSKSFLVTHYRSITCPAAVEDVCVPNAMKFQYFDTRFETCPNSLQRKPTFAHHCQLIIPSTSPFSVFLSSPEFNLDSNGPSSYSTIASQTRCPSGVNVHEFVAYQALFSGKSRRWPQILIELGASNLNFSTEATALLICHLALQVGPAPDGSHLGLVHNFFDDEIFCLKLLDQLTQRLESITSNWRETNCMEAIITLILRLASLGKGSREESKQLLARARVVTFQWITLLRLEIEKATDTQTSRILSQYALWGALLCRKTFALYLDTNVNLEPIALHHYIESSITMRDNMVSSVSSLPILLKFSLIRDMKMSYRLGYLLKESLRQDPATFRSSITALWPQGNTPNALFQFRFLEGSHQWWFEVIVESTEHTRQQVVHFHILEGHLLVDRQPIGKLPSEYTTHATLTVLFGNQNLLSYPSNLPGMAYTLKVVPYGHQIHLGFRNGYLIIRALYNNTILELIPYDIFLSPYSFDLPATLTDNCVHWLDISTGKINIRQRPHIWKNKDTNWTLDFQKGQAFRSDMALMDPNSPLFRRLAKTFEFFEDSRFLTVFQPEHGRLKVELRRLELTFFVNDRGCFESQQLRAEIDPDQDPGTWYGLQSTIVLRDVGAHSSHQRQRSIIVPMGQLIPQRCGIHMLSRIEIASQTERVTHYGRYTINKTLGRLDCPAEPRLLYFKALCHAYTSFLNPDPLTGRTGTEESLHCLRSGLLQPWTPLEESHIRMLSDLASLTPRRVYYPSGMKVMQTTFWNPALTTNAQHDGFGAAVELIFAKSNQLSAFASEPSEPCSLESGGDLHLNTRSDLRRENYRRPSGSSHTSIVPASYSYAARDTWSVSQRRLNVVECATILRKWPSKMTTTTDLAGILQGCNIGGYNGTAEKILLSDILDLDFQSEWGSIINLCRTAGPDDAFRLMFLFSVMSFRPDAHMDSIRTFMSSAILEDLKVITPPSWPSYQDFRYSEIPRVNDLQKVMEPSLVPYKGDELSGLGINLAYKQQKKLRDMQRTFEKQQENDTRALAEFLLAQWPCPEPSIEGFNTPVLVNIADALEDLRAVWLRWFQNWELSEHITQVQQVLDRHRSDDRITSLHTGVQQQEVYFTRCRGGEFPTLFQLLSKKGPSVSLPRRVNNEVFSTADNRRSANRSDQLLQPRNTSTKVLPNSRISSEARELESIVNHFVTSKSNIRKDYGKDLMQSLSALKSSKPEPQTRGVSESLSLAVQITSAQSTASQSFARICEAMELGDTRAHWLHRGNLWPIVTPVTILEALRSILDVPFGSNMKESLILYALSLTVVQRFIRMEELVHKGNKQRLTEEKESKPHSNWAPSDCIDWLLLEIDANILLRPGQVDVACATISPGSGANSVLQMNMGQGKTSCIMPMAAAVLADGKNLLRVVVPKALLLQTAQLLHARFGGLLGREIRHVPFSRKTSTDPRTIGLFSEIHKEIQGSKGCILALPEHLLSFKLSGLQRLSDGLILHAKDMIKVQSWLDCTCRDILDEADYILAIKTQLIYPSGSQKTVDGHPHRWETIETLLKTVELNLFNLRKKFPHSIEIVQGTQARFPVIYFLRKDVEDALLSTLVDDICRGRTPLLPETLTKDDRLAIRQFISKPTVSREVLRYINQLFPEKPAVKQIVHLLRGLFVHRILLMALKKRWNVQYGLHPERDPIAVPYHAKGTPSDQAEWGHPDVAILFTTLSFYYGGLNLAQLGRTLEHVLKSDDPSQVYDTFSVGANMPDALKDWNAINLDDKALILEVWQYVRYRVAVVDYFLNNFVFPRHAKQFQLKLQASGWDIPLFLPCTATEGDEQPPAWTSRLPLTTGFSGTNDWKKMLPMTIQQRDLSGLAHTNAEVLTYLLQERNRQYVLAADYYGKRLSEQDLLKRIDKMGIRVFIDAGAQILEMDNFTLAKAWLDISWKSPAVVYFRKNKPIVLYRHGRQVPLLASPFADDLKDLLVYIDQGHTRGTDLKLPPMAAGALTLGLDQSKDQTTQAAMRLRQLGTTQSVVFFAPPEVHQSILDVRQKKPGDKITSHDVVHWLLEQTCTGIEQLQPLYFSQGADFCRRAQATLDNSDFLVDEEQREIFLATLRQYEQQTLENLYGVSAKAKKLISSKFSGDLAVFNTQLNAQRKGFQDSGHAVHGSALQEVEQEREVAHEVENVREVQKPVHFQPFSFPGLHRDLDKFVKTGRLAADSAAYEHAFRLIGRTSLGRKHRVSIDGTEGKFYVSTEFTRTVKFPSDQSYDNFQRQPHWILWSPGSEVAIVVIPEEAELIIPLLQNTEESSTYLLAYAAPVTRKMLHHFNDFNFYSIPSLSASWEAPLWLKVEIGLFAGRLYFEYNEYALLCKYLAVKESAVTTLEGMAEEIELVPDTFDGVDEKEIAVKCQPPKVFARKPLLFMHEFLALRRKGQDFSSSPMGQVCQGKHLKADHPLFMRPKTAQDSASGTEQVKHFSRVEVPEEEVEEEFYDDDTFGQPDLGADEVDTFDDAALTDSDSDE